MVREILMSSQNFGFVDHVRLKSFQDMIVGIHGDPAEAARFNSVVDTPLALVGYAARRGVDISESEAQKVFEAAQEFVAAQAAAAGGEVRLDDTELDSASGGVSSAAAGSALCRNIVGAFSNICC